MDGRTLPGISVYGQFPGMVPPYEEHKARRVAGYKLPEWRELDSWDRAIEVAQFRIDKRLEAEEYEENK